MKFNIIDFGAIGDGITLNTEAFRRTCEAAAQAADGAAVIVVPPGVFVSGSIVLPSNTTLHLEAGAVVKASQNPDDFLANDEIFPHRVEDGETPYTIGGRNYQGLPLYFIGAFHGRNVIIDGDGTIDGSGAAFWQDVCFDGQPWIPDDPRRPALTRVLKPDVRRPVKVSFWKCRDIAMRDVRIVDASAYTVWTQGCVNVRLQDLFIRNPYQGPNTDALDIDCSENVIIDGCDILAGDDCIALKSDTSRLGEDRPCRNIVVSNCVFSSTACGIRVGYEGDGPITDCSFSNLVIYDTKHAINMLSLTPTPRPDFERGTLIERIQFTNVSMRNVARAFHIWCGTENGAKPYASHISDLIFSDINAVTRNGSLIGSMDGAPIRNVQLRNVHLRRDEHPYLPDKTDDDGTKAFQRIWGHLPASSEQTPDHWGWEHIPDVLWLRRMENVRLDAVELEDIRKTGGHLLRWDGLVNCRRDNALLDPNGTIG